MHELRAWFCLSGVGVVVALGCVSGVANAKDNKIELPPALEKRLKVERDGRRACKLEICKAFAEPGASEAAIACDVTKTWLREEIVARVVGGKYIWRYGDVQCRIGLNLDRGQIGTAATAKAADVAFSEHNFDCEVGKKERADGAAFEVKLSVTPKAAFKAGKAVSVALEPVKTKGSTVASAAVGAVMGADRLSGVISRAAAGEINEFLYKKCPAEGVKVVQHGATQ